MLATHNTILSLVLIILFSPLCGSIIAGLLGPWVSKRVAYISTIFFMLVAFVVSIILLCVVFSSHTAYNFTVYRWILAGSFNLDVGFLIDHLTLMMLCVVTFVSLLVHIYSIGYMSEDAGFKRFFSYMSLFTFMMLMLVTANNFAQLFFGWEGVGLVSYLLIGFWFQKSSAAEGSLKAFIVNRVGDFGFILGIAAVLDYFGSLDYSTVFTKVPHMTHAMVTIFPGVHCSLISVAALLLFIGAMGKSAQMPLHVWLPESMEGPTPISALIHAATMVTAGVFMVARLSPLFEFTPAILSTIMIIGSTGALFMGLLAIIEMDIKRVIAYSTMSQLGYMMAANGASAFSAGIFHLMTHACFKALLFLAAGSVIIAMHHMQDMRKMGNLKKYMPITYVTFLIGALALSAIPPFSGFYSKDAIIDAVHHAHIFGATYSYWCLLIGGFVTALYIFRAFFMTFHGEERFDDAARKHVKESPWVVTIPLICLAIPALVLGAWLAKDMLYSGAHNVLAGSVFVNSTLNTIARIAPDYHNAWHAFYCSFVSAPFWFAFMGIVVAYVCYKKPHLPTLLQSSCQWGYRILKDQYGFDRFNDWVFVRGVIKLSHVFYTYADQKAIDEALVDGSGKGMALLSRVLKKMQTGYLYHYAFIMLIGLVGLLVWMLIVNH